MPNLASIFHDEIIFPLLNVVFSGVMAQNGCKCVKKNCACCAYIPLPEHEALNSKQMIKSSLAYNFILVCVNATYNSETVGLDLAIGVNGHYFTQEISRKYVQCQPKVFEHLLFWIHPGRPNSVNQFEWNLTGIQFSETNEYVCRTSFESVHSNWAYQTV